MSKRATIYQVAELAGVSHQTVSRYLRDNGRGMRPSTLQRVEAAVAELDYRPNLIARSMRTRRTGRLAIMVPGAIEILPLQLLAAAAAAAHDAGYTVELVALEGDASQRTDRANELTDSGRFEGVLAMASLDQRADGQTGSTVVTVADYDEDMRGIGALADGRACGDVVRYLAGLGHISLLHVTGNLAFTSARNRRQTFLDTVAEFGLSGQVVEGDWKAQTSFDAVLGLPANSAVTAVVAANDDLAMGAVRACLQRGWRVPEDVSVFGWDDQQLGRFATPSLSTVKVDLERQGRQAMGRLIALVRGEQPPMIDPGSLHTLIPRESSGPAPNRDRGGPGPGTVGVAP